MDFFASGLPVVTDEAPRADTGKSNSSGRGQYLALGLVYVTSRRAPACSSYTSCVWNTFEALESCGVLWQTFLVWAPAKGFISLLKSKRVPKLNGRFMISNEQEIVRSLFQTVMRGTETNLIFSSGAVFCYLFSHLQLNSLNNFPSVLRKVNGYWVPLLCLDWISVLT